MTRTPVWSAIATALRDDIAQGRYTVGDRLPTEATLAARFGVNRHTVRHAMKHLADEGHVHARRGAGVFVTAEAADYPIGGRVSFHRNLSAAGRMPGRAILTLDRRHPSPMEARILGLNDAASVILATGVSSADGTPIALFTSCFPGWLPEHFDLDLQTTGSVTRALELSGIKDWSRTSTRISARNATAVQAGQLQLKEGAALILSEAVNTTADGLAVEYGQTWFAGDRVTLHMQASDGAVSHG
jgi:GntR family phosphonate transport system transcriptional regulator